MRAISNKLPQEYFLNKKHNSLKARSGIQDIIKTSKHKVMNRCAHTITVLTQHFTFIKLFLPVFLSSDRWLCYIKIKDYWDFLRSRTLTFFLSVKHLVKLQFLDNKKSLAVTLAFLFIELYFPQYIIPWYEHNKTNKKPIFWGWAI